MGKFKSRLNKAKNKICLEFWCPLAQYEELLKIQERNKMLPNGRKNSLAETIRYVVTLGIAEDRRRNQLFKDESTDIPDNDVGKPTVTYKGNIPIIEGIRLMEHD